jgi:sulfoxide reductase catalytic subunit YedY
MLIRRSSDIPSSEITSESLYYSRRSFLGRLTGVVATTAIGGTLAAACDADAKESGAPKDEPNSFEDISSYNNYYEFGTGKDDPKANAPKLLLPRPWTVKIDGLVAKPGDYHLEDILRTAKLEDRVYRHRCVEAWSMVIPWRGFPLRDLINRVQPRPTAKFVQFTTLADPRQMPGVRREVLEWPYIEGLRMDEAMHPLTLMVTGLYGKELPTQNGAPLRVHIPWKYGFKSGKSIVRITFTDRQPRNTWNVAASNEYGFYANVNPKVDHPRWSQARERRIGEWGKRPTLMFNGYADQVASMYTGMDLRRNF